MNMDFYGYFAYGDVDAVAQFAMAHWFAHDAEANAIATQFGQSLTTFNVSGLSIEEEWKALMTQDLEEIPLPMYDWLEAHNDSHQTMLEVISTNTGITVTSQADLSIVDFRDPQQMYDWMTLHQQMHQFEQVALKLT
jgi:hypothetical protein